MTWSWEYVPDEETVAAGVPPAFLVEVEKKADELVRAAEALVCGRRLLRVHGHAEVGARQHLADHT